LDGGATFGGDVIIDGGSGEYLALSGSTGATGTFLQFPDGTTQQTAYKEEIIGIVVDNGSQVLTTGKKGHRIIPYKCEVTEWTTTSTDSGSIEWDIHWCTYANWPTTVSVGGTALPQIDGAYKGQSNPLWTKTTFDAGDIIEFEIDDVTTLTNCSVSLTIRKVP
jgi:hypothetical protein